MWEMLLKPKTAFTGEIFMFYGLVPIRGRHVQHDKFKIYQYSLSTDNHSSGLISVPCESSRGSQRSLRLAAQSVANTSPSTGQPGSVASSVPTRGSGMTDGSDRSAWMTLRDIAAFFNCRAQITGSMRNAIDKYIADHGSRHNPPLSAQKFGNEKRYPITRRLWPNTTLLEDIGYFIKYHGRRTGVVVDKDAAGGPIYAREKILARRFNPELGRDEALVRWKACTPMCESWETGDQFEGQESYDGLMAE